MQSPPLIQSNQENHSKTSSLGLAVRMGGVSGWLGRLSNQSICVLGNVVSNCPGGGSVRVARETVYAVNIRCDRQAHYSCSTGDAGLLQIIPVFRLST